MGNTLEAKGRLGSWASRMASSEEPRGHSLGRPECGRRYTHSWLEGDYAFSVLNRLHGSPSDSSPRGTGLGVREVLDLCIFTNWQAWVWPALLSSLLNHFIANTVGHLHRCVPSFLGNRNRGPCASGEGGPLVPQGRSLILPAKPRGLLSPDS